MSTADEIIPNPQGDNDGETHTEGYAPNNQLGGASRTSEGPDQADPGNRDLEAEEVAKNDPENKNPAIP